jgi:hypothetical protein
VVLLSVVLSVLASAITTILLTRERTTPRAASAPLPPVAPAEPRPIAQLDEAVRRIEERLAEDTGPARRKEDALAVLLGITQGERQLAIEDSFQELASFGNDVVPEIVALLKSGRDRDYGGGFSFGGNKMRGYPRLRTVLIDILRQIGTPEAQAGLLDALRGSEDPLDYRDLLLLYRNTTDETMVRGISGMIPGILRDLGQTDNVSLADGAIWWVRRHDLRGTTDLLEEIARASLATGRHDPGAFAALVEFAPERAFALVREQHAKQGDRALYGGTVAPRGDPPLAQVARYTELLLSLELSEQSRAMIYAWLPATPCPRIVAKEARDADARVLLDFLRKRLGEETGDLPRRFLTEHITALEHALAD